jgi:Acyl-protein synthetase, LuxE
VAENQPANKNRMTTELSNFAARLREFIISFSDVGDDVSSLYSTATGRANNEPPHVGSYEKDFNQLAIELFALQFQHNAAYRKICEARGLAPGVVEHWTRIPAVPTSAFKELELTCLAPGERTTVFHSSGTTEQKPSRHFHNAESLAVYEASLWSGFVRHAVSDFGLEQPVGKAEKQSAIRNPQFTILTPPPAQAPHSSLVHMFETVRQKLGAAETAFVGKLAADGSWTLDFNAVVDALLSGGDGASPPPQTPDARPLLLLGTAFSFVHLLDFLAEQDLRFQLPAGSRVMETGGYKNRSRSIPKTELHRLITERLEVPPSHIICEYGMSELSSQAYDGRAALLRGQDWGRAAARPYRVFRFPPWARVQIISPETGREVADGETGLIRVYDLANVFSVMAIQTEDLGIRRDEHFELIGRAALAEPRGCSLMAAETRKS